MATPRKTGRVLDTTAGRIRDLTIGVVTLAVVVVLLAGWVAWDLFLAPDASPEADVDRIIDDWYEAVNRHDADGALALVSIDFAGTFGDRETLADAIAELDRTDLVVTVLGPPVAAGSGPWLVAVPQRLDTATPSDRPPEDGGDGIALFRVVEAGTGLRIAHVRVEPVAVVVAGP